MKTLGIIWRVVINIITTIIVFTVFSVASTKFETIVLSTLVLIYLSVWSFWATWILNQMQFQIALGTEFKWIKKILGTKEGRDRDEERINRQNTIPIETLIEEYEEEKQKEPIKKLETVMTNYYIDMSFQTVIYIIILYHLFMALSTPF